MMSGIREGVGCVLGFVVCRIAWAEWEGLMRSNVSRSMLDTSGCDWISVGVLEVASPSGL